MMSKIQKPLVPVVTVLLLLSALSILIPTVTAVDEFVKEDVGFIYDNMAGVAVGDGDNSGDDEVYSVSSDGTVFKITNEDIMEWNDEEISMIPGGSPTYRFIEIGDGRDIGSNSVFISGQRNGWEGGLWEVRYVDDEWNRSRVDWVSRDVMGLDIGDGDNDARNEVYVATYEEVYEMSYLNNNWNTVAIGGSVSDWIYGMGLGDIDGNGNLEVYVGTDGDIWQIVKGPTGWSTTRIYNGASWSNYFNSFVTTDGDGDGSNELYVTGYGDVWCFEKSGSSWTGSMIYSTSNWDWFREIAAGDVNNDNKTEVYFIDGTTWSGGATAAYQITYASGSGYQVGAIGEGKSHMSGLSIGDADDSSDGLEVYASCNDGHVYKFFIDDIPPKLPDIWSDTHTPNKWSPITTVEVEWKQPRDPSGIDGFSYIWDASASTVPPASKDPGNWLEGDQDLMELELDEGIHYFHLRPVDNMDNWNPKAAHFGPIEIDATPPTWTSLVINDNETYTNNKLVTLSVYGTDAMSGMGLMGFSNNGAIYSPLVTWNDTKENWDLTNFDYGGNDEDGWKTVTLRGLDKAGNGCGPADCTASDKIFLDRDAPTSLTVQINEGALSTNEKLVDLTLYATDGKQGSGISTMAFSNDGITWSSWYDWSTKFSDWDLISGAGGSDTDGLKYVVFKVKDLAGNEALPVKASIFLDRSPPENLSIVINGGAKYTNNINANLTLNAIDPGPSSSLENMAFSNDGITWSSWEEFTTMKAPWDLVHGNGGSNADGKKTVSFRVRDGVGNVGGPVNATIMLDRAPPTDLKIDINGGATTTGSQSVDLTLSAVDPRPGTGLARMRFREGATGTWSKWEPWSGTKTFTVSSGDATKVVFFEVMDNAGNVGGPASDSIVLDTTAPQISNIKVIGITDKSATVTWETDGPADGVVKYGTTASYGNEREDTSLLSDHSITLDGLTPETKYHFRVESTDEVGNGPSTGPDMTFTTIKTPDTSPPVIKDLKVEGITDVLAVVLWTTNEPADTTLHYGTSTGYGNLSVQTTYSIHHEITVTNLAPGTTYYIKAESKDPSGNGPAIAMDQFTTLTSPDMSPPVITNVRVDGLSDTKAVVMWGTDEVANSVVEFGTTPDLGNVATDSGFEKEHTVALNGLYPLTTYYYLVRSTDPSGNGPTTSQVRTFITLATPDVSPPKISNVKVTGITNNMATVTWTTDELSDSVVQYGITDKLGSETSDPRTTVAHTITLSGLLPGTQYLYRVGSTDLSGNGPVWTAQFKFTTAASEDKDPPIISDLRVENVYNTAAIVKWRTNEQANSIVDYGNDTTLGESLVDPDFVRDHNIAMTGLTPMTVYYLKVTSSDPTGNRATSQMIMFNTTNLSDVQPPVITGLNVSNITKGSAVITWRTDEPAFGKVFYGNTTGLGTVVTNDMYTMEHMFVLSDLDPDTKYYFIALSGDPSGNNASAPVMSFDTKKGTSPPPPNGGGGGGGGASGVLAIPWWVWPVVMGAIAGSVGSVLLFYSRRRKQEKALEKGPRYRGRDHYDEPMEDDYPPYEDDDIPRDDEPDYGDVPMLDMEMDDDRIEGGVGAVAAGSAASMEAPAGSMETSFISMDEKEEEEDEPIRHVKCPACKNDIPVWSEEQTMIVCDECGKKGKIRLQKGPDDRRTARVAASELEPEETKVPLKTLTCSGCRGKVPIYTDERPIRIKCPSCGKGGMLRR